MQPPPIAEEIDLHVFDLKTMKEVKRALRAHRAYTPNEECFFIFLDVSRDFVARCVARGWAGSYPRYGQGVALWAGVLQAGLVRELGAAVSRAGREACEEQGPSQRVLLEDVCFGPVVKSARKEEMRGCGLFVNGWQLPFLRAADSRC